MAWVRFFTIHLKLIHTATPDKKDRRACLSTAAATQARQAAISIRRPPTHSDVVVRLAK